MSMNKACLFCEHREFKVSGYWNVGMQWCNKWNDPISDVTTCAKRDAAKKPRTRRGKYE